jgi:hypothetical protein
MVWYPHTLALPEQGLWSVLSDWLGILIAGYILIRTSLYLRTVRTPQRFSTRYIHS